MKTQTTKKLFAFIIMMMFSISFLYAQCKTDEVLISLGGIKYCTQRCVKSHQVASYLKKGWAPFGCPVWGPGIAPASDKILFTLSHPQKVTLDIYDMTGRLIKTFVDGEMQQGTHQLIWNAKDENGNG